jgi:hypothetical protein
LKWWTLKLLLKHFHFWEFFNLGRLPIRIRPPKKKKKSLYIFPPHFSFHSWGSAFPILPPFLRALILSPFERAFEPSFYLHFESAFEPSTIKGSAFPILPPLECVFEPSFSFELLSIE